MLTDNAILTFLFHITLFGLLFIKLRNAVNSIIIPYITGYQADLYKKWFSLQKTNAILIKKKKQLATQFLQQEKQIALLATKLETWYASQQEKQKQQKQVFDEQAQKVIERHAQQQAIIRQYKLQQEFCAQTLKELEQHLNIGTNKHQKEKFFAASIKQAIALQKKDGGA